MEQLTLDLTFSRPRPPTWDDVQKGRAHVVERIEPCDKCVDYFKGEACTHTADRYAYPKVRDGGMCAKKYLAWN